LAIGQHKFFLGIVVWIILILFLAHFLLQQRNYCFCLSSNFTKL